MDGITLKDWTMILAVILGPILAVQVQKYVELLRARRERKQRIFQTLMATRYSRVSIEHVQALNMIDIEFYGRRFFRIRIQSQKDKEVVEAWKAYHDHLNEKYEDDKLLLWSGKGDELFIELLHKISKTLGYDFDKVQLKRGAYSPQAHGEQEIELLAIRKGLSKILSGEYALPMEIRSISSSEEDEQKRKLLQNSLIDYLEGRKAVKVIISNSTENLSSSSNKE